jgi:hypothetical protein
MTKIGQTKQNIIQAVAEGVNTVNELVALLHREPSGIREHLHQLTEVGILERKAPLYKGGYIYSLAKTVDISVDYAQCTGILRVYDANNSYDKRSKYLLSVTVQWLSKDTAYLAGAYGKLTKEIITLVKKSLKERGAKRLLAERDGELQEEVLE